MKETRQNNPRGLLLEWPDSGTAVIFDLEYTAWEGSWERSWSEDRYHDVRPGGDAPNRERLAKVLTIGFHAHGATGIEDAAEAERGACIESVPAEPEDEGPERLQRLVA